MGYEVSYLEETYQQRFVMWNTCGEGQASTFKVQFKKKTRRTKEFAYWKQKGSYKTKPTGCRRVNRTTQECTFVVGDITDF